jgi:hypothetical protein
MPEMSELQRAVRLRHYTATLGGEGFKVLETLSQEWEKKTTKLAELQDWMRDAIGELHKYIPEDDERWQVYARVEAAAKKLEQEIDDLEIQMEACLTASLAANGPATLELEDGTTRILSATGRTAGGGESLLPRDFLAVWRVAKVFQGSVHFGDKPAALRFGDAGQVATVKLAPKIKKAKKDAVVGEGALFGRD